MTLPPRNYLVNATLLLQCPYMGISYNFTSSYVFNLIKVALFKEDFKMYPHDAIHTCRWAVLGRCPRKRSDLACCQVVSGTCRQPAVDRSSHRPSSLQTRRPPVRLRSSSSEDNYSRPPGKGFQEISWLHVRKKETPLHNKSRMFT